METKQILETIRMVEEENLDIRTITMGISLLDCIDASTEKTCQNIYNKITSKAKNLVKVGDEIASEFGIPIINKRISVTPIAIVASASGGQDCVAFARVLDKAAKAVGINFIGGYSALVEKGYQGADLSLIRSIPEALAETEICLFFCQYWFDTGRDQYGRCQIDGWNHQTNRRSFKYGLCEVGSLCECGGRQSFHGGSIPRGR